MTLGGGEAKARQIVELGRKHPAVDRLFGEVSAATPVTVVMSTSPEWGSATKNGVTTIHVADDNQPEASLYHELLHAELKIAGFEQHSIFVRKPGASIDHAFHEALDNELQHHRFFDSFIAAGFSPEQFYSERDNKTFSWVRRQIDRAQKKKLTHADWLRLGLTLMGPGGSADERKRATTMALLRTRAGPQVASKITTMASVIANWKTSSTLHVAPTLAAILALTDETGYWVGKSQSFPQDGFFLGAPFALADASVG